MGKQWKLWPTLYFGAPRSLQVVTAPMKLTDSYSLEETAAKSLQSCPTLCGNRWQPTRLPSLGFSRQEHWSGLPFPSPMHESEREVPPSCLTLHNPMDCSPPGSCPWDSPGKNAGVGCHFLLQCMKVKGKSLSHVRLFVTPLATAYQAPPSMGFSRQEYWSGLPLPSPIL